MKIIEDILPVNEFNEFYSYVMSTDFPWTYGRKANINTDDENPFLVGWQNVAFNHGKWLYDPHRIIENTVKRVLEKAGEKIDKLLRVRLILNTIADQPYPNGAHTDDVQPHKTALLYLNDSDGETIIYNEKYDLNYNFTSAAYFTNVIKEGSILGTVDARANRLCIFDGLHYHTGTIPTKTARRVVLNINYISA